MPSWALFRILYAAALRAFAASRASLRVLSLTRTAGWSRTLSFSSSRWNQDDVTHTGQVQPHTSLELVFQPSHFFITFSQYWEKDDYRNVRFIDRQKLVCLISIETVSYIQLDYTCMYTWCLVDRSTNSLPSTLLLKSLWRSFGVATPSVMEELLWVIRRSTSTSTNQRYRTVDTVGEDLYLRRTRNCLATSLLLSYNILCYPCIYASLSVYIRPCGLYTPFINSQQHIHVSLFVEHRLEKCHVCHCIYMWHSNNLYMYNSELCGELVS